LAQNNVFQLQKGEKIERELPPVGTTLMGKFRGTAYKARIVQDKNNTSGRERKYDGNI